MHVIMLRRECLQLLHVCAHVRFALLQLLTHAASAGLRSGARRTPETQRRGAPLQFLREHIEVLKRGGLLSSRVLDAQQVAHDGR